MINGTFQYPPKLNNYLSSGSQPFIHQNNSNPQQLDTTQLEITIENTTPLKSKLLNKYKRNVDYNDANERDHNQEQNLKFSKVSAQSMGAHSSLQKQEQTNTNSRNPTTYSKKTPLQREIIKKQISVYVLSYFANMIGLLGFGIEFITATFYKDQDPRYDQINSISLSNSDVQVILLAMAAMYFMVGSSLEYIQKSEIMIFAIMVIFSLGKIVGSWFTNEYLSFKISELLQDSRGILLMISGGVLLLLSLIMLKYFRIDPIDQGYLLNEQALNLTSQFNDQIVSHIKVQEFIQISKVQRSGDYTPLLSQQANQLKSISLKQKEQQDDQEIIESILKRWETPSFSETISKKGVKSMLAITTIIFFKYRIVNKIQVAHITLQSEYEFAV
eukprot:403350864